MCILFPLIILEIFLQPEWSPPVVNSIYWTWFRKAHTCLYKVPQLTVHIRAELFWYPSQDLCLNKILSRSSTDNSFNLMAWFLLLYRQVCAFSNHVQSMEFTTGGLKSSYRNITWMINGNRMHLSSISSFIAKGLNMQIRYFSFLFVIHLQTFLNLFSLCHYGVLCVDWWRKTCI